MEMDLHPKARFQDRVEYRQLEIQNHEINIDSGISNKPQYATARKMQRNASNAALSPNTGMPNSDLYIPAEHTSGHRRVFGDRAPSWAHSKQSQIVFNGETVDIGDSVRARRTEEASELLRAQNTGRLGLPSTLHLLKPSLFKTKRSSLNADMPLDDKQLQLQATMTTR